MQTRPADGVNYKEAWVNCDMCADITLQNVEVNNIRFQQFHCRTCGHDNKLRYTDAKQGRQNFKATPAELKRWDEERLARRRAKYQYTPKVSTGVSR